MTEEQLIDYEQRANMDRRPSSPHRLEIDRDDALELVAEVRRLQADVARLTGHVRGLLQLWDDNHPEDPCGCVGASPDCPNPPPCELCDARAALDATDPAK